MVVATFTYINKNVKSQISSTRAKLAVGYS